MSETIEDALKTIKAEVNRPMLPNESSIYVYAARYAHTRRTGAAMQVVNEILTNWDRFDTQTKTQLKKEAENEATENMHYWKKLIDNPNY